MTKGPILPPRLPQVPPPFVAMPLSRSQGLPTPRLNRHQHPHPNLHHPHMPPYEPALPLPTLYPHAVQMLEVISNYKCLQVEGQLGVPGCTSSGVEFWC